MISIRPIQRIFSQGKKNGPNLPDFVYQNKGAQGNRKAECRVNFGNALDQGFLPNVYIAKSG